MSFDTGQYTESQACACECGGIITEGRVGIFECDSCNFIRKMFKEGDIVRHKKSGRLYKIIMMALMEASMQEMVVYRSVGPNEFWIRPRDEMFDGRFEHVR